MVFLLQDFQVLLALILGRVEKEEGRDRIGENPYENGDEHFGQGNREKH